MGLPSKTKIRSQLYGSTFFFNCKKSEGFYIEEMGIQMKLTLTLTKQR